MSKLILNYENRINNFVIKMAEKPIIVKKERDKYITTRQEFLANTADKILYKKGFSFKSYKSDRDRINDMLKVKSNLDKYLEEIDKIKKKQELKKKLNEVKFIQPSMRFRARNDLERVFDVIRNRENIFDDKKLMNNQSDKISEISYEYDVSDNSENNKKKIEDKNLTEEEKYKKLLHNKILQERKTMIKKRKILLNADLSFVKKLDNNKAKKLREDLYQRTHFKAMENLKMFKTSTMNHNLFKYWKAEDIENQQSLQNAKNNFYETLYNGYPKFKNDKKYSLSLKKKELSTNSIEYKRKNYFLNKEDLDNPKNVFDVLTNTNRNNINNSEKKNNFNLIGGKKILQDLDINKEIAHSNPLLYNLNFNGGKVENTFNQTNIEKLNILKKLAFEETNNQEESEANEIYKLDYDDLNKEENIIINGMEFKKTETDRIADELLKKCNWNEKTVKYKSYDGKLMFTNGLTVKEFEAKYGLLP